MTLHQVDRSLQSEAAVDFHRLFATARVAAYGIAQAEAELGILRRPVRLPRRALLEPASQVGADGLDFGVPDLRNGGREIGLEALGHLLQDGVQPVERAGPAE